METLDFDTQLVDLYHCKICKDYTDEQGFIHYFYNEHEHNIIDIDECQTCKNERLADMCAALFDQDKTIAKVERSGTDYNKDYKTFDCTYNSSTAGHKEFARIYHVDFENHKVSYMIFNKNLENFIERN